MAAQLTLRSGPRLTYREAKPAFCPAGFDPVSKEPKSPSNGDLAAVRGDTILLSGVDTGAGGVKASAGPQPSANDANRNRAGMARTCRQETSDTGTIITGLV
jgi:hypothetical protein